MAQRPPVSSDEGEHLRLFRAALRSKIVVLLVAAVLTWGLWATLSQGDQKLQPLQDQCTKNLQAFKSKWGLPPDFPITLDSNQFDILMALMQSKLLPSIKNQLQFLGEVQSEQDTCRQLIRSAYVVDVHLPYLVASISINGLTFVDFWPFIMIAMAAAFLGFHRREHTNAIVLAWLANAEPDTSSMQLLSVRSNYRVGELHEASLGNDRVFLYEIPLVIQPETLLLYALLVVTLYASLSLEGSHQIELSHEMPSVLSDYFAGLWLYSAALAYFLKKTWNYYDSRVEAVVGRPVLGRTRLWLAKRSRSIRSLGRRITQRLAGSLHPPRSVPEAALSLAALGSLALPWMRPGPIRGYPLLRGVDTVDDDISTELQVQLIFAVAFILLCLVCSLLDGRISRQKSRWLRKWLSRYGLLVMVLVGNLLVHIVVLQLTASSDWWLITGHVLETRPLITTDPAYGFLLFGCIVGWLTLRLRNKALTSPGGHN